MDKMSIELLQQQNPFMSLNDITYTILLQEIVCFRLPPGSWINENAIAKQLGISRSPMKYALSRLEKEGYVKKSHKYSVTGFSIKEYTDLKELCFLFDSFAAGRAAVAATDTQLEELRELAHQMNDICCRADTTPRDALSRTIMDLEYQFHLTLVLFADSPLLSDLYEQIKCKLFRYRSYMIYNPPDGYYDIIATDHLVICDVLALHDRQLAESILRRHLSFFNTHFLKLFHLNGL